MRSRHARPHFVQDLPEGPFADKWTRIFDGSFCEGIEAEVCLERVAAHLSELEAALCDGRAFLGGAEFSAADAAVLPRLLKCPQNHFLRTPLQEKRFSNIIAYVERCLALAPIMDAGAAQTRLFWRPNFIGRVVAGARGLRQLEKCGVLDGAPRGARHGRRGRGADAQVYGETRRQRPARSSSTRRRPRASPSESRRASSGTT